MTERDPFDAELEQLRAEVERQRRALQWITNEVDNENADVDDIIHRARAALEDGKG